jgi:hypothetical protein
MKPKQHPNACSPSAEQKPWVHPPSTASGLCDGRGLMRICTPALDSPNKGPGQLCFYRDNGNNVHVWCAACIVQLPLGGTLCNNKVRGKSCQNLKISSSQSYWRTSQMRNFDQLERFDCAYTEINLTIPEPRDGVTGSCRPCKSIGNRLAVGTCTIALSLRRRDWRCKS